MYSISLTVVVCTLSSRWKLKILALISTLRSWAPSREGGRHLLELLREGRGTRRRELSSRAGDWGRGWSCGSTWWPGGGGRGCRVVWGWRPSWPSNTGPTWHWCRSSTSQSACWSSSQSWRRRRTRPAWRSWTAPSSYPWSRPSGWARSLWWCRWARGGMWPGERPAGSRQTGGCPTTTDTLW